MALKRLTSVGRLSLADFDQSCRVMVYATAEGIRRDIATGGVRVDSKTSYAGVADADVVTSIDRAAQRQLVNLAGRLMPPEVGWIGEEDGLRRAPSGAGPSIVLTFDPADGTKKLVEALRAKRQLVPGEVSVMLGVQVDGKAVAGYVCDVATLVTFARPMYGKHVLQLGPTKFAVNMAELPRAARLGMATLLRHGDRPTSGPLTDRLVGAFARVEQGKSSIGLSIARIFNGDIAGMLRLAGMHVTPWDDTPVQALCEQGDVLTLRVGKDGLQQISFSPLDRITRQDYDVLYVHRKYVRELRQMTKVVTQK
jgi:fructose-1,6-bisphosphatase/inositol monophosphatase family enzyme